MTDKPEIKVGQRWVTRFGITVRILATDGRTSDRPIVCESEVGGIVCVTPQGRGLDDQNDSVVDLICVAPSTVKREVALYRDKHGRDFIVGDGDVFSTEWIRISELLTIEFTLLPGECAA
jgi:hypothetical protein